MNTNECVHDKKLVKILGKQKREEFFSAENVARINQTPVIEMSDEFDSVDELLFANWLMELNSVELLVYQKREKTTYVLSEEEEKHLWYGFTGAGAAYASSTERDRLPAIYDYYKVKLHKHVYTPDFDITVDSKFITMFPELKLIPIERFGEQSRYLIEIKGQYSRARFNPSLPMFSINQKWMLQKHGLYVNKVLLHSFFKKTWLPRASYILTSAGTRRKRNVIPRKPFRFKDCNLFIRRFQMGG